MALQAIVTTESMAFISVARTQRNAKTSPNVTSTPKQSHRSASSDRSAQPLPSLRRLEIQFGSL